MKVRIKRFPFYSYVHVERLIFEKSFLTVSLVKLSDMTVCKLCTSCVVFNVTCGSLGNEISHRKERDTSYLSAILWPKEN